MFYVPKQKLKKVNRNELELILLKFYIFLAKKSKQNVIDEIKKVNFLSLLDISHLLHPEFNTSDTNNATCAFKSGYGGI